MRHSGNEIHLDLDRERLRDIVGLSYDVCEEQLGVEFNITKEVFVSRLDPYLDSNRVSSVITLSLPSYSHPDLRIDVNLRKKNVIARMSVKWKRVTLNRVLTKL